MNRCHNSERIILHSVRKRHLTEMLWPELNMTIEHLFVHVAVFMKGGIVGWMWPDCLICRFTAALKPEFFKMSLLVFYISDFNDV